MVPATGTMPVQPAERIQLVDIVRGFAVLGILIANIVAFAGYSIELNSLTLFTDRLIGVLTRFLVEAKFYSLFSFLFGWGMSVQMTRAEARGGEFVPLYLRRTLLLLVIGLIHGLLIWSGDILTTYALLGFLLLLFRKRSGKQLLVTAGLVLVLPIVLSLPGGAMDAFRGWYDNLVAISQPSAHGSPITYASDTYREIVALRIRDFTMAQSRILYYFGNIFAMFLLGLYAGKKRILENVSEHRAFVRSVLWSGLMVGVTFNGIFVLAAATPDLVPPEYRTLVYRGARTIGAPALMLSYLSGIALLVQKPNWRERLSPLANVGRGALSNYLFQSVVATLIFYGYGLGLYGEFDPALGLALAIGIFLVQVRLSAWWFKRYRFGPVEWIWRTLTYGKRQRMIETDREDWRQSQLWVAVRQTAARLNTGYVLAGTWVVLLIWAGILVNWHTRLSSDEYDLSTALSPSLLRPAATPTVNALDNNAQVRTAAISTPVVQPAVYEPGSIAASGDLVALASTFDAEAALDQIKTLTGAPYLGRYAGSAEGWAAGEYIAGQFADLGLQPAGDDRTFFQSFPVFYTELKEVPLLAVEGPDSNTYDDYRLNYDYSPILRWYSGGGSAHGDVVWASTCSKDDLALIEVEGKVVLCWDSATPLVEAERNVLERGAAGLLLVTYPDERPPDFGNTHRETWVTEPIPLFRVYPSVVDDLLAGSGRSVDDLSISFSPFDLLTRVRMDVSTTGPEACPSEGCLGRNVLGVIPGRDPQHAAEIVIVGAHYDHLGQTPDGTVWPGANDDASGVAVLLEIAQSWQEQGYVPRRTVLFAAWDAEEEGLLGSIYYVQHQRYPLGDTVAMIQLDMVGAGGDTLSIAGGGELGERIRLIAEGLGVVVEMDDSGGSDHVPFQVSGVPAGLLIWAHEGEEEPRYHRPMDTSEIIDLNKLGTVGNIAGIALLGLADGDLAIRDLVEQRSTAVERGDLDAFLATSSPEQEEADRLWFADWQDRAGRRLEMEATSIRVLGRRATAVVRMTVATQDDETGTTVNQDVQFRHTGQSWQWAGPDLAYQPGSPSSFGVAYPPGEEVLDQLGQLAADQYGRNAALLGLPSTTEANLLLFPNARSLQISTLPSTLGGPDTWLGPGEIRLVYSEGISESLRLDTALVQLALTEAGVTEAAAPWLWQGLPLALRAHGEEAVLDADMLAELQAQLAEDGSTLGAAGSWAAVDYLRQRLGWQGLGQFIAALGRACGDVQCEGADGLDVALDSAIQMDSAAFEQAWQNAWRDRLQQTQSGLDAVLAARADAVVSGDRTAFLRTVDPSVPHLVAEERYWFADRGSLESYTLTGQPVAVLEHGILVQVTEVAGLTDATVSRSSVTILFTSTDQGFQWAGVPMESVGSDQVRVLFPDQLAELAPSVLEVADRVYSDLTSTLSLEQTDPLIVKLYDDEEAFRASVSPSYSSASWALTWTGREASVKLLVSNRSTLDTIRSMLAVQLAQRVMMEMGVDSPWLLRGASVFLSGTLDGGRAQQTTAEYLYPMWRAVSKGTLGSLESIPAEDEVSEGDWGLTAAQAWDMVRYLVYSYGWEAVLDVLHSQEGVEVATQDAFGATISEIESAWAESVLRGHTLPEWIDTASGFDPETAFQHVTYLAGPELGGRQAGTAGAESAAAYIAERFAEYGLAPVELASGDATGDAIAFQQPFSITFVTLTAEPSIELSDESGVPVDTFAYRSDFTLVDEHAQGGITVGELVWVRDTSADRLELGGKVVVRPRTSEVEEEIAWAAEHGAVGLVLVGGAAGDRALLPKVPLQLPSSQETSLLAVELAQDGYDRLLELARIGRADLLNSPPVLPLGLTMQLDIPIDAPESRMTANVLGLLRGSDPVLGQEVIIVAAHYDHVGDDPNPISCTVAEAITDEQVADQECERSRDVRYAGANDDASGVAVLLEIARLWHETGYRPQRSILFAAWGAQELGELGSQFYVEHPVYPLDRTVAMLQLDAVGGGRGYYLEASGDWERDGIVLFSMVATSDWIDGRFSLNNEPARSDQLPFVGVGRPAVLVSWRDASDDNWPEQLADVVEPYRLGVTGQIVTLSVMSLAR